MVLSQIDADVTVVGDGEQALQAFGSGNYDLVLMDMHMPVRDGLSATAAIRVAEAAFIRRRTPVVMLTANASAAHVASSLGSRYAPVKALLRRGAAKRGFRHGRRT